MLLFESLLVVTLSLAASAAENNGYLGGVVVRASDGEAVAAAEVVLSVQRNGEFVPVEKTVADENGKFIFEELPVAPNLIYKTGANWGGIHYPGPTTRLTPARPTVGVKLAVNETITEPSPLVARRHEVTIRKKPGILEVSEVLVVENPTSNCYVGKPPAEGREPETLRLSIPAHFDQVTFDKEFYGRRFSLSEGSLVTGIPWTPGVEELRYTYVLRHEQGKLNWTRMLDLPCEDITMRIVTDRPQDVSCSLEATPIEEPGSVTYHYGGSTLEAGQAITVDLGRGSFSPLAYGKWLAAAFLVVACLVALAKKRRGGKARSESLEAVSQGSDADRGGTPRRSRGKRPHSGRVSG